MTKTLRGLERKAVAPIPLATERVPVKRIGRDVSRCYCERCGQKRRACVCDADSKRTESDD